MKKYILFIVLATCVGLSNARNIGSNVEVSDTVRSQRIIGGQDVTFTISPNPVVDFINLEVSSYVDKAKLEVVNPLGHLMYDTEIRYITKEMPLLIPLKGLASGTYYVRVTYNGKSVTRSIVKL